MRLQLLGLLSLSLAVCLSSALVAQDEGRGRGGPGGGRGGFMLPGGGALDLTRLLRDEKVRKEVEMSDEAYKAVEEASPDMLALLRSSESERAAKLKEANEKAQELLDEVLSPEHQKRLMGLLVQQRGNAAAANSLIAKQIGLDEAGAKKMQDAMAKITQETRDKSREVGEDREKQRELFAKSQKDTEQAVNEILTDAQKKALEDLKGPKFEFSEERRFGGGQFGGRGGPPGGGARPGGDAGGGRPPRGQPNNN